MDLNVVVLAGVLACDPEIQIFDSGATLARYLVVVRSQTPDPRLDVIPVTLWGPDEESINTLVAGTSVWIVGTVQRRFWRQDVDRPSQLEVVALEVTARSVEDAVEVDVG